MSMIRIAEPINEMTIEPRQPNLFEKKTNTLQRNRRDACKSRNA